MGKEYHKKHSAIQRSVLYNIIPPRPQIETRRTKIQLRKLNSAFYRIIRSKLLYSFKHKQQPIMWIRVSLRGLALDRVRCSLFYIQLRRRRKCAKKAYRAPIILAILYCACDDYNIHSRRYVYQHGNIKAYLLYLQCKYLTQLWKCRWAGDISFGCS